MDFFYLPWISTLKPDNELVEETECTIDSIPGSVSTKPKYKLTFFPAKGFAEISRLILVYSGEPFIDIRMSYEKWKKRENGWFLRCNNF